MSKRLFKITSYLTARISKSFWVLLPLILLRNLLSLIFATLRKGEYYGLTLERN